MRPSGAQRKRAPTQGRSPNPDQGACRTAPGRRPLRGAAQALPLHIKSLAAQVGRFRRSRNLTLRVNSSCHVAGATRISPPKKSTGISSKPSAAFEDVQRLFSELSHGRRNMPDFAAELRRARFWDNSTAECVRLSLTGAAARTRTYAVLPDTPDKATHTGLRSRSKMPPSPVLRWCYPPIRSPLQSGRLPLPRAGE
jgi:hypothetical protein